MRRCFSLALNMTFAEFSMPCSHVATDVYFSFFPPGMWNGETYEHAAGDDSFDVMNSWPPWGPVCGSMTRIGSQPAASRNQSVFA